MECPKCNALMEPVSYGGSNTTIDRCTQCHGLWFDLDEAERMRGEWMSEITVTWQWVR